MLTISTIFTLTLILCDQTINDEYQNRYTETTPVNFNESDANSRSDIFYKFFNNSNQQPIYLSYENVTSFNMDSEIYTVFLMHGYHSSDINRWYEPLKQALFIKSHLNIIAVNWAKDAGRNYSISAGNIKTVGKFIAEFIIASNVSLNYTTLVGHSLGAQLAGFIGKSIQKITGEKIHAIVALDPAGPKFEYVDENSRLSKNDAENIMTIHTDIGHYGYSAPIGKVDFYPNGGRLQPGCSPNKIDSPDTNCHHARSTLFLIEMMNTVKLTVNKATYSQLNSTQTAIKVSCDTEDIILERIPPDGVYYFETNAQPPYLK